MLLWIPEAEMMAMERLHELLAACRCPYYLHVYLEHGSAVSCDQAVAMLPEMRFCMAA